MVRLMRKLFTGLLTLSLSLILLGLILYNEQSIVQYLNETILHSYEKIVVHKNEYYRPNNYMFVQNTENHRYCISLPSLIANRCQTQSYI